jgi:hypothetical protein
MINVTTPATIMTATIMPPMSHQLVPLLGVGLGAGAAVVGGVVVFVGAGATVVVGVGACVGAAVAVGVGVGACVGAGAAFAGLMTVNAVKWLAWPLMV